MDFDWSTVTFDYNAEENNFAVFEPSTQEYNPVDTIQQSSYQYNTEIIAEIPFEQEIELYEQPINHVLDQQQIIIEQPTMIIEQPTKRTRQEMEQSYIIEVPAIINEIKDEIQQLREGAEDMQDQIEALFKENGDLKTTVKNQGLTIENQGIIIKNQGVTIESQESTITELRDDVDTQAKKLEDLQYQIYELANRPCACK